MLKENIYPEMQRCRDTHPKRILESFKAL